MHRPLLWNTFVPLLGSLPLPLPVSVFRKNISDILLYSLVDIFKRWFVYSSGKPEFRIGMFQFICLGKKTAERTKRSPGGIQGLHDFLTVKLKNLGDIVDVDNILDSAEHFFC